MRYVLNGLLDGDQVFFAYDLLTHTGGGHGGVYVGVCGKMETGWEWSMDEMRVG